MFALMIIDMQVGCFEGLPPRHDADAVVARINRLSAAARKKGLPVVFIQHDDADLPKGSRVWELLPTLTRDPKDLVVGKNACDAFMETPLKRLLQERDITGLYITGCATDFCVDTTLKVAASAGFEICAVSDAHTTRDRPHVCATALIAQHNYVWADLILPRGKVRVLPTEQVLEELARS